MSLMNRSGRDPLKSHSSQILSPKSILTQVTKRFPTQIKKLVAVGHPPQEAKPMNSKLIPDPNAGPRRARL